MAGAGIIPGGTVSNIEFAEKFVIWDDKLTYIRKSLLCDAQTSGGLLIAIPESNAQDLVQKLAESGVNGVIIGKMLSPGKGVIRVY
jgi:selenide,water dikinase